MRVHELAKEFEISSSKLIEEIKGYGIDVKSHLSGLLDDEVDDIRHKHIMGQVAIRLENELQERKKEEDTSSLVLEDLSDDLPEDVEEEPKTEEFNGVEVDEQLNPVDEMEDGEIEIEEQKEMTSAEKETEDATDSWKELARQDDNAEWTKKVIEADAKIAVQQVIVERPTGFFGWIRGLFGG